VSITPRSKRGSGDEAERLGDFLSAMQRLSFFEVVVTEM
jgi:hypothetical protein